MCHACRVENARPALLWGTVGAVVLLAGAAVAAIVLTGGDEVGSPRPETTWTRAAGGCPPGGRAMVIAYFDPPSPDSEMRAAADRLRTDDQVRVLLTETQDEAYARFLEIFAGQPELTAQARPDALPASVQALPVEGVSLGELADHLREVLPEADSVQTGGCMTPTS